MKKMIWTKPQMHEVQFEANEYVSVCVSTNALLSRDQYISIKPTFNTGYDILDWILNNIFNGYKEENAIEDCTFTYEGGYTFSGSEMPLAGTNGIEIDSLQGDTTYNSGKVYDLLSIVHPQYDGNLLESFDAASRPSKLFVSHDGRQFVSTGFERNSGAWS